MPSIKEIKAELTRLKMENRRLQDENEELRRRVRPRGSRQSTSQVADPEVTAVTNQSSVEEKIRLFRNLFRGREDVYAIRWENSQGRNGYSPACGNEWHKTLCGKPKVKCGACNNSRFLPISDRVIHDHLVGKHTIGVYPLLLDGTSWFLAIDFDKSGWEEDARAYLASCRHFEIPAYLERSRSGNGAHVWIFFASAVSAALARKLGTFILTHATDQRPGIGLESYDRFFPSQDTLPKGGFGNLIALPLQKGPREYGHTEFLDEELKPVPDQWIYLAKISMVKGVEIERLLRDRDTDDLQMGVREVSTLDEGANDLWTLQLPPDSQETRLGGKMPSEAQLVLSDQLYVDKNGLPPALHNRLIRLAAFQNPEFYRAQAMRMSTYGKPRLISCADDSPEHIALPRGCRGAAAALLEAQGITVVLKDDRFEGVPIDMEFQGQLWPDQRSAVAALLKYDTGLFCAPTAFGKTVVAAALIGQRNKNTLILVHRRNLMAQWRERLAVFLNLPIEKIGQIGGGSRRQTKEIDVAVIQSLNQKGHVDKLVGDYGHVIVDEAHHVSAFSFEAVLKQARAKYILGLTATPVRKDGHHPIIMMQCGPIRHRAKAPRQRESQIFRYQVIPRTTQFYERHEDAATSIQALYGELAINDERNDQICDDILEALEAGRSPLVLTQRVAHVELLAERLGAFARNVIVLKGGRSQNRSKEAQRDLASISADEERLIIATGPYVGEGFDDARLDTLFLTMPISWKGTLQQYVGRLHRQYIGKKDVRVYDYVDENVAILRRMYERRLKGYKAMGYEVLNPDHSTTVQTGLL